MNTKSIQFGYLVPVCLGLLSACSGGNINFPDVTINGPVVPIQTSEAIMAHGVITDLGNVTVNGVRYTATGSNFTINGQPGTLSDLSRGQVVTVRGTIFGDGRTGSANTIRFDANVIGAVESLDAAIDRLTVMGQTVITGPSTVFGSGIDQTTFAGLTVGSNVSVSGYRNAAGTINATRIESGAANAQLQLIGKVAGLDFANLLFSIERLTVDYSNAVFIDLPNGAPTNGMMVKVHGTMSGGLFIVERLVAAPALGGNFGQRVQTAGLVTRFNSSADFDINESAAAATALTTYAGGSAGDLALNAELVIDGEFAAGGRITANRITIGRIVNRTATVSFPLSDFTEISVPTVFNVTVTQGPDFLVEVMVDEDVVNRVDVTQTGSTLNIALIPGNGSIGTLHAYVTMPLLNRIDLTGVVNASLNDFNQAQMTVNVGGVSRLHGNALMIGDLNATVSGVSQLAFADIRPLGNADIDVSGVSLATVNMDVGSTLTGSVGTGQGTGVSTLFYYGTNVTVDVTTDGLSSIVRLGGTRT